MRFGRLFLSKTRSMFLGVLIGGPAEDFFLDFHFAYWVLQIDLRSPKVIKEEKEFMDAMHERLKKLEQEFIEHNPKDQSP